MRKKAWRTGKIVAGLGVCALAWLGGTAPAEARQWRLEPLLQNQDDVVDMTHAGDDRLFLI